MKLRLRFSALVIFCGFAAIFVRLGYWQIVRGSELSSKADNQHFDSLELTGMRGEIRASDGSVLVGSAEAYLLYVYKPNFEGDANEVSKKLTDILKTQKPEEIKRKLLRDSTWEMLARNVSPAQKEAIENLLISGLGFESISIRFYPEASMSAQVLGFVGNDASGKPKGYFGLEGFYERELRGIPGFIRQEKDAKGNPILVGSFQEVDSRSGRSVVTYIDRFVQYLVENELKAALERYGASAGEVVVMDPKSGAIVANAAYPNYDPTKFNLFPAEYYPNPVVSQSYEPGSTFKVLIMAAALTENLVTPDTKCDACAGPVRIGKYNIRTWDEHYRPDLTMTDVIVHSDNTGMVFAGQKLGEEKLVDYLKKFGIGQKTGIDLEEEATPALRKKWGDIDVATASFGQGVAVTTIQMVRAVGAIANQGVIMTPQVAAEIDGKKISPKTGDRVISSKAADEITEMMIKAVQDGEAKFAAPKGYRIAGKTGTSQIPVAGHYDEDKTITSFVGFAPANDPKFVMITKLNNPTSSQWGSETAAPLWFNIAKKLLLYWGISPDG